MIGKSTEILRDPRPIVILKGARNDLRPVSLEHKIPVHLTYFTAVVDDAGKLSTFADVYGLDNKMATALFGSAAGFPVPPPEPKKPEGEEGSASYSPARRTASSGNDIAGSLSGFLGD